MATPAPTEPTAITTKQPQVIEPQKLPDRVPVFSLAPRTFDEAMRFSKMLAESDLAPKDFKGKPANVLIAIQMGAEVGLPPMAAIQNIAVINGRPSIWGDAALAIVMAHRDYETHDEKFEGQGESKTAVFMVKRKGHEPYTTRFSVNDAKRAALWGKAGPWTNYPDRMLQMRARAFGLRDKFADALRGLNIGEESQDLVIDAATVEIPPADPAIAQLKEEISALLESINVNAANRMMFVSANEADLKGALEALKTIKYVLTAKQVPLVEWAPLISKFAKNIADYASKLLAEYEKSKAGSTTESAAPEQGCPQQQPAESATACAEGTGSGEPRPTAGELPTLGDLFSKKQEAQPQQQAKPSGRFKF